MRTKGAFILRENTGTSGLEQTLRTAVETLAHLGIPHLVVGGMAVQEHGHFRATLDVDLVVPDVPHAVDFVTADLTGPFRRYRNLGDTVVDTRNNAVIHFLPAGYVLRAGCQVPFPQPGEPSDEPCFVTLEQLIALKLDSWRVSPFQRLKDKADVVELIKERRLPRSLAVVEPVRALYQETWDGLDREKREGCPDDPPRAEI
ncbi:MAG: hypothetical protein JNK85_04035 [Verrucomicrobiales bacterium]|nr:hypothetical protein [Verrucomicrobiales bacterium]